MTTTVGILRGVGPHGETVRPQKPFVLRWIEAGVIERLPAVTPDRLTLPGTSGEHQWRPRMGVRRETRKHRALVVHAQMKEAVPRENAIEAAAELQRSHIRDEAFSGWKSAAEYFDHRRR